MEEKKQCKSSPLLAAVIIVLAFLLMIVVFLLSGQDESAPISLPDGVISQAQQTDVPQQAQENFVQVTTENVQQVVRTLYRPSSYHQVYTVIVAEGEYSTTQIVDLWNSGSILRADITSDSGVFTMLTDREKLYVWYSDENEPAEILLNDTISPDDLLGLPTYELLLDADPATITEAGYVAMQESVLHCIYVLSDSGDGMMKEYWIDVDTGLLYKASFTLDNQLIYSAVQKDLSILAPGDAAFKDQLHLPDGTNPFSAE